jgi:hypothetical protein
MPLKTQVSMLAYCINPDCRAPLHSFSEGRLYQFEIVSISIAANDSALNPFDEKPARQAVHYWLCGRCAASLDLQLEPMQGLRVVPLVNGLEPGEKTVSRVAEHAFEQGNRC